MLFPEGIRFRDLAKSLDCSSTDGEERFGDGHAGRLWCNDLGRWPGVAE